MVFRGGKRLALFLLLAFVLGSVAGAGLVMDRSTTSAVLLLDDVATLRAIAIAENRMTESEFPTKDDLLFECAALKARLSFYRPFRVVELAATRAVSGFHKFFAVKRSGPVFSVRPADPDSGTLHLSRLEDAFNRREDVDFFISRISAAAALRKSLGAEQPRKDVSEW